MSTPKRQRGAALVLVLMLVAVFLILMGSLVDALALESQSSIESADSAAAVAAAYSGVDLMVLSIEEYYQNGIQGGHPPQAVSCDFSNPGGGSTTTFCTAKIDQTWNGNGINYYLIRSTGNAIPSKDQEVDREVVALIKQVPFGAYAHFSESEHSNTGGPIWYSSSQSYNGPVYSGGDMHIMYNSADFKTPIFPMGFTTDQPQSSLHWMDVADNNNSPPSTKDELASVYGSSSPTFAPNGVNLPGFAQNLVVFSEAYYGDSTHDNTTDLGSAGQTKGVFVNGGDPSCPSTTLCTGIFISGATEISSTSVPDPNGGLTSGSQTWNLDIQDFGKATITVDFGANTTTVTTPSGTKTYSGVASGQSSDSSKGNGAFFVDGDLTIDGGSTVHGQYTVAVPDPPVNGESLTLTGSLTDISDPRSVTSQDEVALWADDILLRSQDQNPLIEAMILTGYANECTQNNCGGWFGNYYCTVSKICAGGVKGNLTVYGSDIENLRGKMGIVDSNGDILNGYLRGQTYDPRLGADPPPFSPATNLYSIVALQDVGSPGH